eukprot:gene48862-65515_t
MSGARARSVGTNRQRAVVAPPIIDKVAPKPNRFGSVNAANKQSDGKVIGQYRLGKTLGEGTFGKVRLAIHIPTGEKVAVKVLEKNRIKDQADVRRVNREIKILKKANHSNIIQLYEVFDTNETIYLMMENADGGEMFDYIVSHRYVQERQASDNAVLKLADFGLAQLLKPNEMMYSTCGTPVYVAPEILRSGRGGMGY